MKILLTGCEGYIGSIAGPYLMARGHDVMGVDTGFFREARFGPRADLPFLIERRDTRTLTPADLEPYQAVIHMAEISNDPMGALNPGTTEAINHQGSVQLATHAKTAGVERFVHMSSCSVYGIAEADLVDEQSPLNPQTVYAECKRRVELDVGAMADQGFCPTFLRNATAYGVSPRIRFDLVLNNLCGLAQTEGEIRMISDGTPWRPIVHIRDISQAIACVLAAPPAQVRGECINVGSDEQNYQVRDIARLVGAAFPGCRITMGDRGGDTRSYRVTFKKLHAMFPEFACDWKADKGAAEFKSAFDDVALTRADFQSRRYIRMKQLTYLSEQGLIDRNFYWTTTTKG